MGMCLESCRNGEDSYRHAHLGLVGQLIKFFTTWFNNQLH